MSALSFLPRVQPRQPMRLPDTFQGVKYRLADNWISVIEPTPKVPIKYAEVGAFYGANIVSVALTYGAHPESKLIAIDPWKDYDEYSEYKGQQDTIYGAFLKNIEPYKSKIEVKRGYSHEMLPTLKDGEFDIIYIDGNHNPEYALEDAVLAFRKVKPGGYLIFDDYGWGGPDLTQRGIDAFAHGYYKRINILKNIDSQVFIRKLH